MTYIAGHMYTVLPIVQNSDHDQLHCFQRINRIDDLRKLISVYPGDTLLCLEVDSNNQHSNHFHSQSGKIIHLSHEFTYRVVEFDGHNQNV